jgi:hypothetical protein
MGFEVLADESLVDVVWEFPYRPFVEFGPEDEDWARRLGFGREISVPSRTVSMSRTGSFQLARMHPDVWEEFKQYLQDREKYVNRPRLDGYKPIRFVLEQSGREVWRRLGREITQ